MSVRERYTLITSKSRVRVRWYVSLIVSNIKQRISLLYDISARVKIAVMVFVCVYYSFIHELPNELPAESLAVNLSHIHSQLKSDVRRILTSLNKTYKCTDRPNRVEETPNLTSDRILN